MSTVTQLEIKNLPASEIEIAGEIPAEIFETYWKGAIKRLTQSTEIDGFRKGHVPEAVLLEKIGEMSVLEEMAVLAIEDAYREILTEKKIDALGRPELTVTKMARNNPLGFTIKTAIAPEVTLPDYKKLAKEVMSGKDDSTEASDEEVMNVLKELANRGKKKHDHADHEGHDHPVEEEMKEEAPVIDDAFAVSLGSFKDLADLKAKVGENIGLEKAERNRQKKRVALLDKLNEATTVTLPRLLLERETEQMLSEMQYNVENMGLTFDDYLSRIKKTAEEIKKESEGSAEKRIKVKLILKKIGEAEKVTVPAEEVTKEVEKIMAYYKDVNPDRAAHYAEEVLQDEKVFALLEQQ